MGCILGKLGCILGKIEIVAIFFYVRKCLSIKHKEKKVHFFEKFFPKNFAD